MLISSSGTLVRTPVAEVSVLSRNTQGVRLIRLDDGERLAGVGRIENLSGDGADGDAAEAVAGRATASREGTSADDDSPPAV
jgi:DNA gyrase subunit A